MHMVNCMEAEMAFILRKVWSWKRIEAFPGLGIALSLVTVLIYQVYVSDLFKRRIDEPQTPSTNQQFSVWQCCCKEDDGKHICDGLLERNLSGAPGDFCLIISHCQLCVQYAPPLIHNGQNPFPRNKLPLLAIR